jgi:type IX secretion system PorP/SprF family membrane protein
MKPLALIFTFYCARLLAQVPEADQYYINLPGQNPAFTGIDNFLDLQLRYRKTWSQFGSNPSIVGAALYGKIGKAGADVYRNNSFRVSDPTIYGTQSTSLRRKHGYGLSINSFEIDGYDRKSMSLKYALHIPVSKKFMFSLGTSAQFLSERFNLEGLTVRDPINDVFYQSVMDNGNGTISSYSLAFGGALYSETFFLGLGASSLLNNNFSITSINPVPTESDYHLVFGKSFKTGSAIAWQPTLRISYDGLLGTRVGAGLRARYKDLLSIGLHYQSSEKLSFLFGLNAKSKVRLYYAYDYFINELGDFKVGNHEVIVRVPLLNKHALNSYCW